jgi:hypothetical protein
MQRRDAFHALYMLCAVTLAVTVGTPEAAAHDQPNVVLMMADDVGWEAFGCYGGEGYETPHIDALASRGIRFNHCSPDKLIGDPKR